MATPLKIDIALWYHCRVGDYGKHAGDNNFHAPAVQEALQDFVNGGLLAKSPDGCSAEYYGTEALSVWVEGLCNVPWPVQKWVLPVSNGECADG
jgi:hypothetical protein